MVYMFYGRFILKSYLREIVLFCNAYGTDDILQGVVLHLK